MEGEISVRTKEEGGGKEEGGQKGSRQRQRKEAEVQ